MKTRKYLGAITILIILLTAFSTAIAAPAGPSPGGSRDATSPTSNGGPWSENWDSYATGQDMHGVGGWKGWQNDPAFTAFTTDVQARSAPNSIDILGNADLVHEYATNAGQWVYTAWQYIPGSMTGLSYFIMLNQYDDAGVTFNWSIQVSFDSSTGLVLNEGGTGGSMPFIADQWVEIRVEIDLDGDTVDFYYDNALLFSGIWSQEVSGGGIAAIGAVDLFANGATSVFYDDLSLTPAGGPSPSPEGKTYEVTPLGGPLEGVADCWTFGPDRAFSSSYGSGKWLLRNVGPDKAKWGVKISNSINVNGITRFEDGTLLRARDNSDVKYAGFENPTCGAP